MTESEIQNAILLKFGREPDVTLWRQNTGVARSEVVTRAHLERLLSMMSDGSWPVARDLIRSLLAEKPRFTPYGLCKGSSDIIGIVRRVIPDDAGGFELRESMFCAGVFLALEVKRPGKNPTREQQQFLDIVNRRGGVGRCVHSEDEAKQAIDEARQL